jgi:DNA-binding transcriptional MerR regulator
MYSTKTFARLTGVTIKALRLYDRLGLLVPTRTDARHRRYATADIQRLERVLALKSLGLELSAVQTLMRGGDVSLRVSRARERPRNRCLKHAGS